MTTYLPTRAAANVLDVHPETLREWARTGRVPARRTPGGHLRFNPDECLAALSREPITPARPPATTTRTGLLADTIRRQADREGQS